MNNNEHAERLRLVVSRRIAGINVASAFLARALNVGILLWYQHTLLTELAPSEFGLYPVIMSMMFVFSLASTLVVSPCQRFVTYACARDERPAITEVFSSVMPLACVLGGALGLVGCAAAVCVNSIFVIPESQIGNARAMVLLLICGSAANLIVRPSVVAFFALQRLAMFHLINLFSEVLRLALLVSLLYFGGAKVLWIVLADQVASIGASIVLALISRRMIPELHFTRAAFSGSRLKELVKYGVQDIGISVAQMLHNFAPFLILNRYASPVDVTSFHLGMSAHRQSQKVWLPVREALGPPLIAMEARDEPERMRRWYYKGSKFAFWAIMFACAPLMVFREPLVELYATNEYADGGTVLLLLLLRYPFQMCNALLPHVVRAKGIPGRYAKIALASESILALAILITVWGLGYGAVAAAACCLAVSIAAQAFLFVPLALRLLDGRLIELTSQAILPGLAPAIAATIVWSATGATASIDSWINLIAAGIPGAVVYALALIYLLGKQENIRPPQILAAMKKRFSPSHAQGAR